MDFPPLSVFYRRGNWELEEAQAHSLLKHGWYSDVCCALLSILPCLPHLPVNSVLKTQNHDVFE